MRTRSPIMAGILAVCAWLAGPAVAQTTLPRPDPPFVGKIERTLEGSHADIPAPLRAPAVAPNLVVVLVDDAGFGNPATFGGPASTPTLDHLASGGLQIENLVSDRKLERGTVQVGYEFVTDEPGKIYYRRRPFAYPGTIQKVVFDLK